MLKSQWLLYLWPGLPDLWRHGSWSGLALAGGFAALLNLTLAVSFIWTGWIGAEMRWMAWLALAICCAYATWSAQCAAQRPAEAAEGLFSRVQSEYLQGNWFAAEKLLSQLMQQNCQDVDAQLMLASLYRHTARLPEAEQALGRLSRLEGCEKWTLEIHRERQLLAARQDEPAANPAVTARRITTADPQASSALTSAPPSTSQSFTNRAA